MSSSHRWRQLWILILLQTFKSRRISPEGAGPWDRFKKARVETNFMRFEFEVIKDTLKSIQDFRSDCCCCCYSLRNANNQWWWVDLEFSSSWDETFFRLSLNLLIQNIQSLILNMSHSMWIIHFSFQFQGWLFERSFGPRVCGAPPFSSRTCLLSTFPCWTQPWILSTWSRIPHQERHWRLLQSW